MKTVKLMLTGAIIPILLLSCLSLGDPADLLDDMAWEFTEFMDEEAEVTVAVYYFTEGGAESSYSDYVINHLTTSLSNALREEEYSARLVSRSLLDRIMDEHSFQLSGLTDPERQLSLGKLLGADIIVAGTITSIEEGYEVNAQLVEVESGIVLGGAVRTVYP